MNWRRFTSGLTGSQIACFFDVIFPKSGLIDGKKVANFVREYVHADTIENLPLPFQAVATDIRTGEELWIDQGDVIKPLRASISAPGIFTPVRKDGRILVDGGLVNPVPVSAVRCGAGNGCRLRHCSGPQLWDCARKGNQSKSETQGEKRPVSGTSSSWRRQLHKSDGADQTWIAVLGQPSVLPGTSLVSRRATTQHL